MAAAEDNWYDAEVATFGDRLTAARMASNMTPEQLAKRVGIKLDTMRKWENDLSEPRANRLSMLAGILGVSITWLITGEGEGVGEPDTQTSDDADASALLVELRDLRVQFKDKAEQVGRIEKRLRTFMREKEVG